MQIILQEDIDKLGHRGDVVTVKPGYARNYLLPRKLAVEATEGNLKAIERIRTALAKKTATELEASGAAYRAHQNHRRISGDHQSVPRRYRTNQSPGGKRSVVRNKNKFCRFPTTCTRIHRHSR